MKQYAVRDLNFLDEEHEIEGDNKLTVAVTYVAHPLILQRRVDEIVLQRRWPDEPFRIEVHDKETKELFIIIVDETMKVPSVGDEDADTQIFITRQDDGVIRMAVSKASSVTAGIN